MDKKSCEPTQTGIVCFNTYRKLKRNNDTFKPKLNLTRYPHSSFDSRYGEGGERETWRIALAFSRIAVTFMPVGPAGVVVGGAVETRLRLRDCTSYDCKLTC